MKFKIIFLLYSKVPFSIQYKYNQKTIKKQIRHQHCLEDQLIQKLKYRLMQELLKSINKEILPRNLELYIYELELLQQDLRSIFHHDFYHLFLDHQGIFANLFRYQILKEFLSNHSFYMLVLEIHEDSLHLLFHLYQRFYFHIRDMRLFSSYPIQLNNDFKIINIFGGNNYCAKLHVSR